MIIRLRQSIRDLRLAIVRDALDSDTNPGYLELYSAIQPTVAGEAISNQTLLGTFTLSAVSGVIETGVMLFNSIADELTAEASDEIGWGRFYNGAGVFVLDGDAGDEDSEALIKFDKTAVQQGGLLQITLGALTEGNL